MLRGCVICGYCVERVSGRKRQKHTLTAAPTAESPLKWTILAAMGRAM